MADKFAEWICNLLRGSTIRVTHWAILASVA
ncbi:MAG: hypothetical protein ACI8XO_002568 [Verrucomicrobiales bacterium]